jgi:hypothetical protein
MARVKGAGRRPEIEKWLEEDCGFQWEYREKVTTDNFDTEACLRNQARLGTPLEEETIERYVAGIQNGDPFPAVVAAPARNGLLVTVDGNHRLFAHIKRHRAIDVYVILNGTPAAIIAATMEANTKHGLPTTEDQRIHHALWLMDNGLAVEEAAKRLALSKGSVTKAKGIHEGTRRADDAGFLRTEWEELSPWVRARLGNVTTDEGFKALTRLVMDARLGSTEVNRLVQELNAERSFDGQMGLVDHWRTDKFADAVQSRGLSNAAAPGGRRTPRQKVNMTLGQIAGMPKVEMVLDLLLPAEAPELLDRLDAAIDRLTELRKAVDSIVP